MHFIIIGSGMMSIPPRSWGGVENVCDNYRNNLLELGHTVDIVNTRDMNQIIAITNALTQRAHPYSTFVHIHYDDYAQVADHLQCKNVAMTSHYGYLEQTDRWSKGYNDIFWSFVNSKSNIFCLSEGIKEMYLKAGVEEKRLWVIPNSIRTDLYNFSAECKYPNRTLYLAKIDFRKRQHMFQNIESMYFAGGHFDDRFDKSNPRWLGEWRREKLYNDLTEYANLALLSDGEAHPAVCQEAFSAGLGVVISECSAANLDLEKRFIDVIPEEKIRDNDYIEAVLESNRRYSVENREEILEYAKKSHGWESVTKNFYLNAVYEVAGNFEPFVSTGNVKL